MTFSSRFAETRHVFLLAVICVLSVGWNQASAEEDFYSKHLPTVAVATKPAMNLLPPNPPLETISEITAPSDDAAKQSQIPARLAADRTIYDVQFTSPQTHVEGPTDVYTMPKQPAMQNRVSWVSHRAAHRTLYFQDNPLERHGKTNHPKLQPIVSVFRFAADVFLAPMRSVHQRANALHYASSPR